MLREIKVQIARRHLRGTPIPHPSVDLIYRGARLHASVLWSPLRSVAVDVDQGCTLRFS